VDLMSLRQKYLKILSGIVPAGAVGVSLLLGSTAPSAASQDPSAAQPSGADAARVSERLAAIREAVSDTIGSGIAKPGDGEQQLAWGNWWHNGGWYRPYWRNGYWRPWGNWRNGWNNWGNWWRNW
jgi:rSAM-associated Gly-rich repeat protein